MRAHDRLRPDGQGGFTLIELLMALALTGIVMLSVYGLLSGGQNAFRREPALTERQQSIRVAMDRVLVDAIAGSTFIDNQNGTGASAGPAGATDRLWFLQTGMSDCPDVMVDDGNPTNGVNINTATPIPLCYPEPGLYLIFYENGVRLGWGHNVHSHNDDINFPPGQQPPGIDPNPLLCDIDVPPGTHSCPEGHEFPPVRIGFGNFIKYEIRLQNEATGAVCDDPGNPNCCDPTTNFDCVPSLWRTDTGGWNVAGGGVDPNTWQLVSRGIENMQVRYLTDANWAAQTWTDTPGSGSTVRKVEITLGARTLGEGLLQGATGAGGLNAMRGQLRATVMPRYAITTLSAASPAPTYQ